MSTHRLLSYSLLARCTLLGWATITCALGLFSPGSLTARLLDSGGYVSTAVLAVMCGVVVMGWLDVVVNDLWPGPAEIAAARLHEHAGYLVLGMLYWVQALAGAANLEPGGSVLIVNYMGAGVLCCWYGWTSAMRGGRHG